ncbi:MAG: hypothetical protein ACXITV_04380 [Luteibaculaceae bacterium]
MPANKTEGQKVVEGTLAGLILPIPTFFVFALIITLISGKKFLEFLQVFYFGTAQFKSAVLSVCALSIGAILYYFYKNKELSKAKGAMVALFIYAFAILYFKLQE